MSKAGIPSSDMPNHSIWSSSLGTSIKLILQENMGGSR